MKLISKQVFINKEYIVHFEGKTYKIFLDCTSQQFPPGQNGNYITELELDETDDMWIDGRTISEVDDAKEHAYIWKAFIENIDINETQPEVSIQGFIDWCENTIGQSATDQKKADDDLRARGYAIPEVSAPIAFLDVVRQYILDKHTEYCRLTGITKE